MIKPYRKWQTLILAVFTFAVFVWAAIDIFDVDPAVMWQFFLGALVWLVGIVILAAIFITVVTFFRSRRRKS